METEGTDWLAGRAPPGSVQAHGGTTASTNDSQQKQTQRHVLASRERARIRHHRREPRAGDRAWWAGKPIAIEGLHTHDGADVLQKGGPGPLCVLCVATATCAVGPEGGGALETKRGATPDLKRAFPPHPQSTLPKLLPRWSLQLRHLRGVRLTNAEPTSFLVHLYYVWLIGNLSGLGGMKGESAMPPSPRQPRWELAVHTTHVCLYFEICCPKRAATWGYR